MAKKKVSRKKAPTRARKTNGPESRTKVIPDRICEGQKFCLAGRFKHPDKNALVQFIESEGGEVENKLSSSADYLILGSGGTSTAERDAKKRNEAGANIQVLSDMSLLLPIGDSEIAQIIVDDQQLRRLSELTPYLYSGSWEIRGAAFDGGTVGAESGDTARLNRICFQGCSFKRTSICNIEMPYWQFRNNFGFSDCLFKGTQLSQCYLAPASNCVFDSVEAVEVQFGRLEKITSKRCHFNGIAISGIYESTFDKTKIEQLSASYSNIKDCVFTSCEISDSELQDDVTWKRSELKRTRFIAVRFAEGTSFQDCKLEKVEFRDCHFESVRFGDCELSNCRFTNCTADAIDLGNSKLKNVNAKGFQPFVLEATEGQLKELKGCVVNGAGDVSRYPLVRQLANQMVQSGAVTFSIQGKTTEGIGMKLVGSSDWPTRFHLFEDGQKGAIRSASLSNKPKYGEDEVALALLKVLVPSGVTELDPSTLTVKTRKCPLRPTPLKKLILSALHEALGVEPQSDQAAQAARKQARVSIKKLREVMKAELQAGDVLSFNQRTEEERKQASPLKKLELAGVMLRKLNAAELALLECDLTKSDLREVDFTRADLRKSDLSGAKLDNATFVWANLTTTNLSNASLKKATLKQAELRNTTNLGGTDLRGADLTGVSLTGVDLSTTKLSGAKLTDASYDQKTQFPKSTKTAHLKKMRWFGDGLPPHERKQNKQAKGPLDFDQFMERLKEITDASKLSKSTKMLKKDSFELFSEVSDEAVYGVVKSQTDPDLVYSCFLGSDGGFACCTQNLNACGGLRGSLCKHILVLVVGLAKGGELDPTRIDEWVNSSKMNSPQLDKDRMSEVLLKYKGAEAGEIDWRPTETVPEDFFAF